MQNKCYEGNFMSIVRPMLTVTLWIVDNYRAPYNVTWASPYKGA